jgi:hypothetical protein
MIMNAKRVLSLVICLIGLALVIKTIAIAGAPVFSAGTVAGSAFFLFGAVRFYYSKGVS